MIETERYLEKLSFWDRLSEKEKDIVKNNALIRPLEKGGIIYNDEDSCLGMIYVISGVIRVFVTSGEGREVTLYKLSEGDACTLSASCVIKQINFDSQMSADTDAEIMIIPSGTLEKLIDENIYVKCNMLELSTEKLSQIMWVMEQIIFAKFDKRMATFMIGEYKRTGNEVICMTQESIAKEVNSAREVVARMLKTFAEEGFIELNRGAIRLRDIESLEAMI